MMGLIFHLVPFSINIMNLEKFYDVLMYGLLIKKTDHALRR